MTHAPCFVSDNHAGVHPLVMAARARFKDVLGPTTEAEVENFTAAIREEALAG